MAEPDLGAQQPVEAAAPPPPPPKEEKVVPLREPGTASQKIPATSVSMIIIGGVDSVGRPIDDVYFKRANYAIYCSHFEGDRRVLVQYADAAELADKQIVDVALLIPLRNRLQAMLSYIAPDDRNRYFSQIAEAFRLGLEKNGEVAKQIIESAIQDVQLIRSANGRNLYIKKAYPYVAVSSGVFLVVSCLLLYFAAADFSKAMSPMAHLLMAASAGSLGALLSIAISVRARTVSIDGDDKSIAADALLRILIGFVSAGVLYLLLNAGILANVQVGEMKFSAGAISWQFALILGFAAGFLERLVPDLLEKKKP